MNEHKISSIVVVDTNNQPVGIFTEHDSLRVVSQKIDFNKTLQDVMTPNPFCIDQSVYLHDAYMIMEEKGYRHLVVVDATNSFVGIVTEGDFLRHMGFEELGRFKSVADIITKMPLLISPDATLLATASLMQDHKADYVVLMEGKEVLGVVTERDIAYCCIHENEPYDRSILSLAHKDFEIVGKDFLLSEARELMSKSNVHQLIIVDDNKEILSLLTRHDILHAVHGSYFEFFVGLIENKNDAIAQLNEQTTLFRTLLNTMPDLIWLKDIHGVFLLCN